MIVFTNPGLIDLDASLILGVNAKATDAPIGYFGTGLKFALATLLRHGCTITIYRGDVCHIIGIETLESRGKTFQVVTLDNAKLGFTTDLGRDWKPWQAYRELHSNMRDEGGMVFETDAYYPVPDMTAICVHGDVITQAHNEREWFLLEGPPDFTTKTAELTCKPAKGVFYRGVMVYADTSCHNLRYTWNIKKLITLSEDRSAKYLFQIHEAISEALDELAERGERDLVADILCFTEEGFERNINYNGVLSTQPHSGAYLALVGELMKTRAEEVNPSARLAYARLSGIDDSYTQAARLQLTPIQDHQFERAAEFCEMLGYPVRTYPIVFVERLSGDIMGVAKNGTIYVTKQAFDLGTKQVAATLIEEYIHIKYGVKDCTREMQDVLFNKIVGMGEEFVLKEPL